jgi:hypothetical protein
MRLPWIRPKLVPHEGEAKLLVDLDAQEERLGEGIRRYGDGVLWLPHEFPHHMRGSQLEERSDLFARLIRFHAMSGEGDWVRLYATLYDAARGELNRRALRRSAWVSTLALVGSLIAIGLNVWTIQSDSTEDEVRRLREAVAQSAAAERAAIQTASDQRRIDAARERVLLRDMRRALRQGLPGQSEPRPAP